MVKIDSIGGSLIITLQLLISTNSLSDYQEGAIMAHVIGNGAMNMGHYFRTLGIECENRNPGFWKVIDQDHQKCSRGREEKYYEAFPIGSFLKMCRKWKNFESCNRNLARDLDECLGKRKGSDAFEFMNAYTTFSCRDVPDTESQLAIHPGNGYSSPGPGVFKCFPELQDRILTCVKKDIFSSTQCSQIFTVQDCFAQFYSDYQNCKDIGVVGYLRDLFKHMSSKLRCSGPNPWDISVKQIQSQTRYFQPTQQKIKWNENESKNNKLSIKYKTEDQYSRPMSQNPQFQADFIVPVSPMSVQRFETLNRQLPTRFNIEQKEKLWKPMPLPPPPPHSATHLYRPADINEKAIKPSDHQKMSSLGSWFNLQQRIPTSEGSGPTWAWGYERYGNPQGNDTYDRFFTFRKEPKSTDVDKGAYDIYNIQHDREGVPFQQSRKLSNRVNGNRNQKEYEYDPNYYQAERVTENVNVRNEQDNHLRKFKNDHEFQIQTTPRVFIHSYDLKYIVPSNSGIKRTAKVQLNQFKINDLITEESEGEKVPINQIERNKISNNGIVKQKISATTPAPHIPIQRTLRPRPFPRKILISTTMAPLDGSLIKIGSRTFYRPTTHFPIDSEEERPILSPAIISTTRRPRIIKKIRVRKRKQGLPSSTTSTTAESSTEY